METSQKQREKEAAEFETLKAEELNKMKKEKRVFERQMRALQNVPNRKEREEIEQLKKEVADLKEEAREKKQKHKLGMDRAKKQIDDLASRNAELENEVKVLEELRLSHWNAEAPRRVQKRPKENRNPAVPPACKEERHASPKKPAANVLCDVTNGPSQPQRLHQQPRPKVEEDVASVSIVPAPLFQTQEAAKIAVPDKSASATATMQVTTTDSDTEEDFEFRLPKRYHAAQCKTVSQTSHADGKVTRVFDNGKTEVALPNGTRKETFPDGYSATYFANGDVKQIFADGRMVYFSAGTRTTQTTLLDGLQVYKFANGQLEKRYADGTKEVK